MDKMNEIMFGPNLRAFDLRAREVAANGQGVWHRHRIVPAMPQAGDTPTINVEVNVAQAIERVQCTLSEPDSCIVPLTLADTTWDMLTWSYIQTWEGTLPAYPNGTVVRYTVGALPRDGSAPLPADGGERFSYLVGSPPPPAWAAEARIYQIFVDRFNPGAGRDWNPVTSLRDVFGGTLRGIIEKLDYLAALGINCLWLTPIFPDKTAHGYHALDYFTVNPRAGTLDDARNLLHEAHERGIRVLLDFVANHVGHDHPAFIKAQTDRESDEYHWFTWRSWPDEYEAYFNIPALPKLNTNYPGVRDYLLRSIRFWIEDVGFDGLRLDHANGPTHDFWTATRALIEDIKPEAWVFGEVVAPPPFLRSYAGRLHGVLDFPLTQALRDTFAFETMSLHAFDAFLTHHDDYFPPEFSRPSFLDNHDMDRFLWIADDDVRKLKLAALCLVTLGGPPILYAGTELGLSQSQAINAPDSVGMNECRLPMPWENLPHPELQDFFRDLLHFREKHPVLWNGERHTVHVDDATRTYAYMVQDPQEVVIVALNLSDEPRAIPCDAPTGGPELTLDLDACSGITWVDGQTHTW